MTTPSEEEARAEAEKRWPQEWFYTEGSTDPNFTPRRISLEDGRRTGFVEGAMWAASRVSTPPSEDEARAELDRREEYAEAHGHPTFQDEGSAFLSGARWSASTRSPEHACEYRERFRNQMDGAMDLIDRQRRVLDLVKASTGELATRIELILTGPVPAVPVLPTEPEPDPWCREESCEYRHWRSGEMPTNKRGAYCPAPTEPEEKR